MLLALPTPVQSLFFVWPCPPTPSHFVVPPHPSTVKTKLVAFGMEEATSKKALHLRGSNMARTLSPWSLSSSLPPSPMVMALTVIGWVFRFGICGDYWWGWSLGVCIHGVLGWFGLNLCLGLEWWGLHTSEIVVVNGFEMVGLVGMVENMC